MAEIDLTLHRLSSHPSMQPFRLIGIFVQFNRDRDLRATKWVEVLFPDIAQSLRLPVFSLTQVEHYSQAGLTHKNEPPANTYAKNLIGSH